MISAFGVWAIAGYGVVPAGIIAVAATAAEAFPGPVDDNARITAAAGLVAALLA
jgi:hypothetical protein